MIKNFLNPKVHQWFKSYGHFTEGVDFAYETLEACASISVPKLRNFHLLYLVNFVKY